MYTRFDVTTPGVHHARHEPRTRVRRENQPAISLRALFFSTLSLLRVLGRRFTLVPTLL